MMKKTGFTLIELMVIITIIGLLLLMAIPAYMKQVDYVRFSEIVIGATDIRRTVNTCFALKRDITQCMQATDGAVNVARNNLMALDTVNSVLVIPGSSAGYSAAIVIIVDTTFSNNAWDYFIYGNPDHGRGKMFWAMETASFCISNGLCDLLDGIFQ